MKSLVFALAALATVSAPVFAADNFNYVDEIEARAPALNVGNDYQGQALKVIKKTATEADIREQNRIDESNGSH